MPRMSALYLQGTHRGIRSSLRLATTGVYNMAQQSVPSEHTMQYADDVLPGWNLHGFINQCHPKKFNNKKKTTQIKSIWLPSLKPQSQFQMEC